jgi:hypothetical protein
MTPAATMRGTAPRITKVICQLFINAIVKPAAKVNTFWRRGGKQQFRVAEV